MEVHGGELMIASEPGRGTSMRVRLPVGEPKHKPDDASWVLDDERVA